MADDESKSETAKFSPQIDAAPKPVTAPPSTASGPPPQTKAQVKAEIAYMWVGPAISFLVLAGFFVMVYLLLQMKPADLKEMGSTQNVLFILLGALGAAFTQVVNYWLGSSKGSADKTALLKTAP